jgi:hypothetical protein
MFIRMRLRCARELPTRGLVWNGMNFMRIGPSRAVVVANGGGRKTPTGWAQY